MIFYNKKSISWENSCFLSNGPYDVIIAYTWDKFLQGGAGRGGGFMNSLKIFLWIKVQQLSTDQGDETKTV